MQLSHGFAYAIADVNTTAMRCCRPSYDIADLHTLPIGTYLFVEVAPIDYDCFEIFKTVVADADFNTTRADSLDCHTTMQNNLQTHHD